MGKAMARMFFLTYTIYSRHWPKGRQCLVLRRKEYGGSCISQPGSSTGEMLAQ